MTFGVLSIVGGFYFRKIRKKVVRGNNNAVDEILSRCNIVDVIGQVVPLKRAGSNYKGLCPFHNEKTPSFIVSETKQIFTCFGCGATGNVIGFVEKYYNLDFKGAVEKLASDYGIDIRGTFGNYANRDEAYEINRLAARFFYRALREKANPGYTYMRNRGISDETLNKFGIGYADDDWHSLINHLTSLGYKKERLYNLGLAGNTKGNFFDKFRGRVMFPIINTSGKIIGFGGRIIGEGEPKYLNSPESAVFKKKNNLYGLNLAREAVSRENSIILVEGYMDVISLSQAGVRNVVASLGTALTENQARLIKRYANNVILSYDADGAGQNAANRGLDILYSEGLNAKVLKVDDGKDPDEYIKNNGKKAFEGLIERALPHGDFKIKYISQKYNLNNDRDRSNFTGEVIGELKKMRPVEADIYLGKLAEVSGISEAAIRSEYNSEDTYSANPVARQAASVEERPRNTIPVERDLIKLMLCDSKYRHLPDDVKDNAFRTEIGITIYEALSKSELDGPANPEEILETLEGEAAYEFKMIIEGVMPGDRDEEIYRQCLNFIRKRSLKEESELITVKLSMADGEISVEEQNRLMKRQIEIQKLIQGQGGV